LSVFMHSQNLPEGNFLLPLFIILMEYGRWTSDPGDKRLF
jgi:hypothetical protein